MKITIFIWNLSPKNKENLVLYNRFRNERKLYGELKLRTGSFNKSLSLRGEYLADWKDFDKDVKVAVFKIMPRAKK